MPVMRIGDREITVDNIYKTVLNHFPDMIHFVDSEGKIIYANQMATNLLGYSRNELIGMPVTQLYPDRIRENVQAGFKELQKSGEKRVESQFLNKQGHEVAVEIRSFAVYDDDGNFLHTFSQSRDLRVLRQLEHDLIHASRLAGIGEMSAGIAHDLNNPVSVIGMSSRMILDIVSNSENLEAEKEQIQLLAEEAVKATDSAEKLATHLLSFSRKVTEEYRIVDISSVVDDALFLADFKIRKARIQVDNLLDSQLFTYGAANQLEQVFVNLLNNACDAMKDSDIKRIAIDCDQMRINNNPYWVISVRDTGPGLPEELREKVFESFYTTKREGAGTGLGLSIARGIVNNHQGEIHVDVDTNATFATVFEVSLPQVNA
jgi:PAS domain S-box-containing protein